jgi:hypothetical protein
MLAERRILDVLPTEQFRRASTPAIREFVGAMELEGGPR